MIHQVQRNMSTWLNVKTVAKRMAVSERFVYSLIAANEFPAVRLGRAVRGPADAFEQWLADKEEAAKDKNNEFGSKARSI